eukprot:51367-Rhodomonas_salina.4
MSVPRTMLCQYRVLCYVSTAYHAMSAPRCAPPAGPCCSPQRTALPFPSHALHPTSAPRLP